MLIFFTVALEIKKWINNMNRSILIKKIASRLLLKEEEASLFIRVWEEELSKSLKEGDSICLMGFGSFSLWKQVERPGRDPRQNTACMIAPRNSVKFKPSKELLAYLNNKTDNLRNDRRRKKTLKNNNDNISLDSFK